MSRTVYVNGVYTPEAEARISVFDRGFLMADAGEQWQRQQLPAHAVKCCPTGPVLHICVCA